MSDKGLAIPKIIVTLSDVQNEDNVYVKEAEENSIFFDIIEYRADLKVMPAAEYKDELLYIKSHFPNKKILFTYRMFDDRDRAMIEAADYYEIIKFVITNDLCDIIDIDLMIYEQYMTDLLLLARQHQIEVLISHHEFQYTPRIKDMLAMYKKMITLDADYCKLAVMPHDGKDVLNLMDAVYETKQAYDTNVIGIAMGDIGKITRLACGVFGSSMTFGYVGEPVAPGQIHVRDLHHQLALY
ncbi:type I 3-dehydroquinate dehydratase [Macrococcoides canis]|uniref:3-dehydroquinate dehydratase n=1 Tax=Macrococcoides canis TaxID=1855823 RepID=A0A4R6C649_9STAP|nr:type I 3-dehydroquinate dehydratase [Macrococcus canis]TDM17390.1 type I 3-dehydroquinate dehydratase [Macrococcus canis]TDM20720.1 type I 3-dehydroquinate dehydratase [Macrococcus canis]TDM32314.1 type I 3-dehydroquinate dehydratase [Macrococcus canis]TDM34262.1 type I 3-dehydroquinate dehydratase [Macrococcus canis]TDM36541.1 type I 3-dehydroquinate dehydratase [Macrococcus canis]